MTDTTDTPVEPSAAQDVPVVDTGSEPVAIEHADDSSLTQELEAVVARIDDEPDDQVTEEAEPGTLEADPSVGPEQVDEPAGDTTVEPEQVDAPADDTAESTDDIESAISSAEEKVASEPTLDDIAPGTVAHDPAATAAEEPAAPVSHAAPWWPFVAYDVLWLVFAGALVWYFEQLPAGVAVFEAELYGITILVGVVLAALGPALILATWIGAMGRPGVSKSALFFSALVRGSVATVLGVAMWWIALLVLDQLRLGRIL